MTSPATPLNSVPSPQPARSPWLCDAFVALFLVALFLPAYFFAGDRYWLPLFTRYMALAIFALSVDLIWGYTGLLSLGQGLYFGLGVYAVGYSLKLQQAWHAAGRTTPYVPGPDMPLPDFMAYCRLPHVPAWIQPLIDVRLALFLAVFLPTVAATLFGLVTFRLRIKGVFFSLVTQALLLAVFTLVDNNQPITGGRVGMTYLNKLELFGAKFQMLSMYYLVTGTLVVAFLGCALLTRSKFGRILTAIRDNENRVLALGYNTAMYKTFIFAVAGGLAGLAGALYVAAMGTAGPDRLDIAFSIEVVILVAVGGRGTLLGAILGAVLVNLANTLTSDAYPQYWPILLGALFIGVVLFLPEGIVGGVLKLAARVRRWRETVPEPVPVAAKEPALPPLDLPAPAVAPEPKGV
jgi:urea transport system permease protein